MSTLLYGSMTAQREQSKPGTSSSPDPAPDKGKPGVNKLVDTVAALVPVEVLAGHALILGAVAERTDPSKGPTVITIARGNLDIAKYSWIGLIVAAAALYAIGHLRSGRKWDASDFLRLAVPPLAFVSWTALQSGTLFDAVAEWTSVSRTVLGVFIALALVAVTKALADVADKATPQGNADSDAVVTATGREKTSAPVPSSG